MKRYVGLLSEINDLRQKNQIDVDAYVNIAKKYHGKILELGSGTGNLSLGLTQEGYDVTCLEIHRDMIHLHEEKMKPEDESLTTIILGDMCSFDLNQKFDLIIAAQNVINSLTDEDLLVQMLSSVKRHLTDTGIFVIECDYPNLKKMQVMHDKEVVTEFKNPRSQMDVENRVTSYYNFLNYTRKDKIIVSEYRNGRIKRRIQVMKDYRMWRHFELIDIFKKSGLHIMMESGDIKEKKPIHEENPHMIYYLKR